MKPAVDEMFPEGAGPYVDLDEVGLRQYGAGRGGGSTARKHAREPRCLGSQKLQATGEAGAWWQSQGQCYVICSEEVRFDRRQFFHWGSQSIFPGEKARARLMY